MTQLHFDPGSYLALMAEEVPAYARLQDQVAAATTGLDVTRALELGTGTGEAVHHLDGQAVARLQAPGGVVVGISVVPGFRDAATAGA